jgi:hypothetical protein
VPDVRKDDCWNLNRAYNTPNSWKIERNSKMTLRFILSYIIASFASHVSAATWSDVPYESDVGDPAIFALIVLAISIPSYIMKEFKKSKALGAKAIAIVLSVCGVAVIFPAVAYFLLSAIAIYFVFLAFKG